MASGSDFQFGKLPSSEKSLWLGEVVINFGSKR
jgi:hypothetical protein